MKRIIVAALSVIGVHRALSAEQKHDLGVAVAQTAPGALAATGAQVVQPNSPQLFEGALTMNTALASASLGFMLLQCAYLVWKWRRDSRRDNERRADRLNGRKPEPDSDLGGL